MFLSKQCEIYILVEFSFLSSTQHVKYLIVRVILDTRLTWSLHIEDKLQKAKQRLAQLYLIFNRNSYHYVHTVLYFYNLYKTIISPLILYVCSVWGNAASFRL